MADATQDNQAPRALITGAAGQDGSYLAEMLLASGYSVFGVVESDPSLPRENLSAVQERIDLCSIDLTDRTAVDALIERTRPTEIYNLAAPSFVPASWDDPTATLDFMSGSTVRLLDAIVRLTPETRYFQASSSEIFRGSGESPQNEQTTPRPTSPYGVGKLAGHGLVDSFRIRHGVFACSGILYNHESPRRPIEFVPRKIVSGAVAIAEGRQEKLILGDLGAQRDWGFAPDYVKAMSTMLRADTPGDYVVATGEAHTVADLVAVAFSAVGLNPEDHVETDPRFMRAGDEALLVGDPSKIEAELGWRAETSFEEMVAQMVSAEQARR